MVNVLSTVPPAVAVEPKSVQSAVVGVASPSVIEVEFPWTSISGLLDEETVTVAVFVQPFVFIYVITLVPAETPVTKPVALTVATLGVAEVQGVVAWAVAEPVNCVVEATTTLRVPVIVGNGFTVIIVVPEFVVQPVPVETAQ